MSKAEEFRRATEEFWSKMDKKGWPATAARKPTLSRFGKSDSGNRPGTRGHSALAIAATTRKTKKRAKR
jgi:hypothetical protein